MMRRGGANESEATRRLKVELLQQMDGMVGSGAGKPTVLATTNKPWDLDDALLRRLEKRVYIPLPDQQAREASLKIHLAECALAPDVQLSQLATSAVGFSGSDLRLLCREAAMAPMRRVMMSYSPSEIAQMKQS